MLWRIWDPLLKALMGAGLVEIENILLEEAMELLLMQDQEVIQAFSSHTPQKTFTDRIRLGSSIRCSKYLDPSGCGHARKTQPKFPVIIPDEVFGCLPIRRRFSQLLRHPRISGRTGHIHMNHLPRL